MESLFQLARATAAEKRKLRVLVIDDHPLVRDGLASLIDGESDLACCGSVGTSLEALEVAASVNPDLVLVDLLLGNEDGFSLIKALRTKFPGLRMLVISQLDEALHAERALRAGALGYVMKERATDELLNAIRKVLAGETYASQELAATLRRLASQETGRRAKIPGDETINKRQRHPTTPVRTLPSSGFENPGGLIRPDGP